MYTLKGINLSYDGLVRFIRDNKLVNDVRYYTILPVSKFHIDTNVEHDNGYDMVAAKLPIKIKIDKFYPLSMDPKEILVSE